MAFTEKEKQPENPKIKSSLISQLLFWWINPIIRLGNKRNIQMNDLYKVMPEDESERLGFALLREWRKELTFGTQDDMKKRNPSLENALIRTFGLKTLILGLFAIVQECMFRIVQCLCLGKLLHYFDPSSEMSRTDAYVYALGVILSSSLFVFVDHPYTFECYRTGMQIRTACCSLLFRKCMRLSQNSLRQTNIGQMINIMSSDVDRFNYVVYYFHYVFVGPLQTLISTILLFHLIGPICLIGVIATIIFVILQSCIAQFFKSLRMGITKGADDRIRKMNELLSGIRVIKMFAWEKFIVDAVEHLRRIEVDYIRRFAYCQALFNCLISVSPQLVVFCTLVAYVLTGNTLSPEKTFLIVALFTNVVRVMSYFVPHGIKLFAQARIAIKRVQDLLLLEEIAIRTNDDGQSSILNGIQISMTNVTAIWSSAATTTNGNFTLQDVSLIVPTGQLLAVIGPVGSGKSSLLKLILGELPAMNGTCRVAGRAAYASQEPWIFSGTIRENILCGLDYDDKRYEKVIKAAALERDFSLFPYGDETAVGERGVTLSGGQKARVSLARCLYIDADVYLLDDPLSAVDTYVGRHLFDTAIKGFLRDKTRILVTHQVQYLKVVDQILVLKEGKVQVLGSFIELKQTHNHLLKCSVAEVQEETKVVSEMAQSKGVPNQSRVIEQRDESFSNFKTHGNEERRMLAAEPRSPSSVPLAVYSQYFLAGGGYTSLIVLVLSFFITGAFSTGSDYWLNIWTNAEQNRFARNVSGVSTRADVDTATGIFTYSVLIVCVFIFSVFRTLHLFGLGTSSSATLHNRMLHAIIHAPILFFDSNPIGRILNRFTKDIGCMDDQLMDNFYDFVSALLVALGSVVLIGLVNIWLVFPVFVLASIVYSIRGMYSRTANDIKQLEAISRSPVYSHLSTTLLGLMTIRAHKYDQFFLRSFHNFQDIHGSAWYMFLATSRWIAIWVDWICIINIACVTLTCVALRDVITGSEAGIAIASTISMMALFSTGVRMSVEVENKMTSVQRVVEYGNISSEEPLEKRKKPPPSWPEKGNIHFNDVSFRYSPADQVVLKHISFYIKAGEKIGIVGRTGAGKSSIVASLFRFSQPDGKILIDGIDIKSIGLYDLRSKISIIPQDPFLFSGSLRENLDPTGLYDDDTLWNVLGEVKLEDLPAGLDFTVEDGGGNLSVGQRQLVCLARAILQRNKILVLDEATANVDHKMDAQIQISVGNRFKDCTVLTIAHRLITVMRSDRILVIDAGVVKEFDTPAKLLGDPTSLFYHLVQQSGLHQAYEFAK